MKKKMNQQRIGLYQKMKHVRIIGIISKSLLALNVAVIIQDNPLIRIIVTLATGIKVINHSPYHQRGRKKGGRKMNEQQHIDGVWHTTEFMHENHLIMIKAKKGSGMKAHVFYPGHRDKVWFTLRYSFIKPEALLEKAKNQLKIKQSQLQ